MSLLSLCVWVEEWTDVFYSWLKEKRWQKYFGATTATGVLCEYQLNTNSHDPAGDDDAAHRQSARFSWGLFSDLSLCQKSQRRAPVIYKESQSSCICICSCSEEVGPFPLARPWCPNNKAQCRSVTMFLLMDRLPNIERGARCSALCLLMS